MRIDCIGENSPYNLDPKYAPKVLEIIHKKPELPFKLENNSLIFKEYTIGEIRLVDLIIKILPRNKSFKLQSFFEILQYLDTTLLEEFIIKDFDLSTKSTIDINSFANSYYNIMEKLFQFGITGNYTLSSQDNFEIKGDINFDNYNPAIIPYEGINTLSNDYHIDIKANQILKLALNKLIQLENKGVNLRKFQILRELDFVSDYYIDVETVEKEIQNFNSTNPFYSLALMIAKKLLFNLDVILKDGVVEWASFLENSNTIFEKYIFKILSNNLNVKIEKWQEPKKFATINYSHNILGQKSFSPDLLINFNNQNNSAFAVLDVKNKSFEPEKQKIDDLVSTSDLYQLMFYCRQLNSNYGGLVYPSSTNNIPLVINLEHSHDLTIYLFSINMRDDISKRHKKLVREIKENIISKI